ncbi:3'-5' exonuclease [Arabiibacter massiliensis]|uniref:3'-5' exonuclease n=1 Tax=Arabiibacter massiliensis TaxID=1870985 RepID=UPI001E2C1771|nr:3'-5' exonuclease [Arabiibacter massiliensis]
MRDTIAAFDGRIAKVQGPARSGKTEALVRRCARLVREGTDPAAILVEVSNAVAAQAFRRRLRRALGPDLEQAAAQVHVETALDTCAAVLDDPAAREATGHIPRLLNSAEYAFFLEDMKALGQPVRRLRATLDLLYRQMADLVPRGEWHLDDEGKAVLAHGERVLTLRGAMLAQEAPALCALFLESEAGSAARGSFAHVLCDDFQNLSRAEQACLRLLAGEQLIVAGNPNEQQILRSGFPSREGFTQFEAAHPDAEVFTLEGAFGNPSVIAFADALCEHGDMDPSFKAGAAHAAADEGGAGVQCIKWATPEDEIDGIAKYLRAVLDTEDDLRESRTCVLVPNKRWALMAEKALRRRGFSVSAAGALSGLGGDPRESARARALVAFTRLNLLADPCDMVAWRSWCGFDSPLVNSDAWAGLQDFAEERALSLYDALAQAGTASEEPFPRAAVLAERWRAGQDFIAQNAGRKGFSLLRAIGADGLPEFEEAARAFVGDEDAAALLRMERAQVTDPAMPEDAHVLHVATFGALVGVEYDNVFVVGAVDGLMPRRAAFEAADEEERERAMNEERRLFCNGVAKAGKRLVVSHFNRAPLELAERAKMQVSRVRTEGGSRMAVVRPVCFLAEAGDACPGTVGGQALLAELGLA